jgi:hypothetical protein
MQNRARYEIETLSSELSQRMEFALGSGIGIGSFGGLFGPRDYNRILAYHPTLSARLYREMYERGDIAERFVEAYPCATWGSGEINVIDDPKAPNGETAFSREFGELAYRLGLWEKVLRADILAQLGRYSILLIGAPGDLNTEMPIITDPDNILYVRPYDELSARITSYYTNETQANFGQAKEYTIRMENNDVVDSTGVMSAGVDTIVHASRVIHLADGCLQNEYLGKPCLRSIWNRLIDLMKILGGGSEASWRTMNRGIHIDIDPETEFTEEDEQALEDEIEDYNDGTDRTIRTFGNASVTALPSGDIKFGENAMTLIKVMCATKGIPLKVIVGSQEGGLGAEQSGDRDNWSDRYGERRNRYGKGVVNQIVERFVKYRAISPPITKKITINWPVIEEMSEKEKAELVGTVSLANYNQWKCEGKIIVPAADMSKRYLGVDYIDAKTNPIPASTPI